MMRVRSLTKNRQATGLYQTDFILPAKSLFPSTLDPTSKENCELSPVFDLGANSGVRIPLYQESVFPIILDTY
jgi:hypothetical protein